jgi:alpha-beta hydrolase superfamily lysophospholipase
MTSPISGALAASAARRLASLPGVRVAAPAAAALAALAGGAGWHYSGVLLRPDRRVQYLDRVTAIADGEVWLRRTRWAEQPGEWALRWPDGMAVVGPVSGVVDGQVRRPLRPAGLVPPVGPVAIDAGPYDPDPSAHGLAFQTVPVPGPLGDCPAWLVPASGSTWVIAVHGRGADQRESLRVLPVLHQLGHPVLAISYRNDLGAPASPDGHYHLGDTEWEDLAAAVDYALAAGASGVVLYGWSMGAAITGAYLDRAAGPGAAAVRAVVWDSPLVDWRATLRQQAALRRLPPGFTPLATGVTRLRIGIDFGRFDLVRRPPRRRPPTLLFHGDADTAVPVGPSRTLAAEATRWGWPVRYVEIAGAEHTAAWNVDRRRYESAVADFLTEYAPRADSEGASRGTAAGESPRGGKSAARVSERGAD